MTLESDSIPVEGPERDLATGSIRGHVLALAPMAVLGMALMVAFEVVDAYWVGRMAEAEAALGALALGTYCLWTLYAVGTVLEFGAVGVLGRRWGEGDPASARRGATRSLFLAGLAWIVFVAVTPWVVPAIVRVSRLDAAVAEPAAAYLRILFYGSLPIFLHGATSGIFRAAGDTKTMTRLMAVALVINGLLDPWLVFGGFGLPALGLEGAAWASIATRGFAVMAALVIVSRRRLAAGFGAFLWRRWAPTLQLLRIGLPVGSGMVLYCATFIGLARLLADYPVDALAGYVVGQKIEALSWSAVYGISTVAGAFVGQNLGANRPDRAAKGVWMIVLYGAIMGTLLGLIYAIWAEEFIVFFAPQAEGIVAYGRIYLLIIAATQGFLALEIILQDALAGSGDTLPPTIVTAVFTTARVPLAWFFGERLGGGVTGIFLAIGVTTVIKGILMALWFRRGSWVERGARRAATKEQMEV